MPKTIEVVRYSFEELSEEAKAKALEGERQDLAEFCPTQLIEEQMQDKLWILIRGLDDTVAVPDNFKFEEWDVSPHQGQDVRMNGTVTKAEAPLLPWPEGADSVTLMNRHSQLVSIYNAEGDDMDDDEAMTEKWRSIRRELIRTGADAYEDYSSEEHAKEQIEMRAGDSDDLKYVYLETGEWNRPK